MLGTKALDAGATAGGSQARLPCQHLSPLPAGSSDHDHLGLAVVPQGPLQLAVGWLTAVSACRVDIDKRAGQYFCVFLPETVGRASVNVEGPPKVNAVKKSEQATEREEVVLVCKSESFPPVSNWEWYKISDAGDQVLTNNSQDRIFVVSTETKTELHIRDLDLKVDSGQYICNGTSAEGSGHAVITLRVRSHLAALWPFLGIVAEVLVLVTIIFIYEKRRKPDEVLDDEDTGSAPL
ncbi:basigin (Ok blood group) [Rhinolophus ferrumequinum]|uniref:Basigin n=1 Tax=Rhinolophus ferrumequinum TaxID=59479 RepID=A0A7J7TYX3_RHIFE|nr:basigin (Ok blood group) [Rhinolophus ferrumequinum]